MFNSSNTEFILHPIIHPPCETENNAALNRHKRSRSRNTKTFFFSQAFIEVLECRLCFLSSEIKSHKEHNVWWFNGGQRYKPWFNLNLGEATTQEIYSESNQRHLNSKSCILAQHWFPICSHNGVLERSLARLGLWKVVKNGQEMFTLW